MCGEAVKLALMLVAAVASASGHDDWPWPCDVCLHRECLKPFDHIRRNIYPKDPSRIQLHCNTSYFYYIGGDSEVHSFRLPYYYDYEDDHVLTFSNQYTKNNSIALDQATGELYYYNSRFMDKYKYYSFIGTEELMASPHKLWVFNRTIYFTKYTNNEVEKGLNVYKGSTFEAVPGLKTIVNDVVFDARGNMYIQSDAHIYKLGATQDRTPKVLKLARTGGTGRSLDPGSVLLSGSKSGDIYVFDRSEKVIYIIDPATEQLRKVGSIPSYKVRRMDVKRIIINDDRHILFVVENNLDYFLEYYALSGVRCEDNYSIS